MSKKILFAVGTRPEIIKTAPVILELKRYKSFRTSMCLSGQHTSMVEQMLKDFELDPDYRLNIMEKGQTLTAIVKKLIPKLEKVYDEFNPDMIFVQGDTTTAFVAALVAFYKKIKVAHIEAGLRTFDRYFPFPEEVNRTLITRVSDRNYAPTVGAKKNLVSEGVDAGAIVITGNTGIDALKYMAKKDYQFVNRRLRRIPEEQKVILLTAHRRENFGKRLLNVFRGVKELALRHKDVLIVYPVHPNPNVKEPAYRMLSKVDNIMLVDSLQYRDMVKLMKMSSLILTDSGGIQEEASSLGKPVLILRDNTERPEAVSAGSAKLVGADRDVITVAADELLLGGEEYRRMAVPRDIYGDGRASRIIAMNLKKWMKA